MPVRPHVSSLKLFKGIRLNFVLEVYKKFYPFI